MNASPFERDAQNQLLRNPTFQAARAWALQNWSDEELAEYNRLASEPATRGRAVDMLYADYLAARQVEEEPAAPEPPQPRDPNLFYSQDEMAAAMKDPRYQTDPRYREEVTYKLHASKQAGTLESTGQVFRRDFEVVARLEDRMPDWHAAEKRRQDQQRAAEHAERLRREAEAAAHAAERALQDL